MAQRNKGNEKFIDIQIGGSDSVNDGVEAQNLSGVDMVDDLLNQNIHINLSEMSGLPEQTASEQDEADAGSFQQQKAEFKKLIQGVRDNESENEILLDEGSSSVDYQEAKLSNTQNFKNLRQLGGADLSESRSMVESNTNTGLRKHFGDMSDGFSSLNTVQVQEENEKQMQKYEADIRQHISIEQQLQIYIDSLKQKMEDMEGE